MDHQCLKDRQRAEQLARNDDVDGQFIFLWIAFNAAYAIDIDEKYRESEPNTFRAFLYNHLSGGPAVAMERSSLRRTVRSSQPARRYLRAAVSWHVVGPVFLLV